VLNNAAAMWYDYALRLLPFNSRIKHTIGIGGCGSARRTASAYTSVGLAKKQSAKLIVLYLPMRDGFMHVV